jgi:hypothetical protein
MNMPYRPPTSTAGNGGFNIFGGDPVTGPGNEFGELMNSLRPPGLETSDPREQMRVDMQKSKKAKAAMEETEAEAMQRIKKQAEAMKKALKMAPKPNPKPPASELQYG